MNSDKSLLSAAKGGRKIAEFSSGSGYGCMLPRSKEGRRTFTCGRASLRSRARARARVREEEGVRERREPGKRRESPRRQGEIDYSAILAISLSYRGS